MTDPETLAEFFDRTKHDMPRSLRRLGHNAEWLEAEREKVLEYQGEQYVLHTSTTPPEPR